MGLKIRAFGEWAWPDTESCRFHLLVYQQTQQQQLTQSYGGYKEPAAPVSIQRSAPGGGGVSICLEMRPWGERSQLYAPVCGRTHTHKDKH